jgi:AraC-like DNA-binding protein
MTKRLHSAKAAKKSEMEAYTLIREALGLAPPFKVLSVSLTGNGDCYVEIAYDEKALNPEEIIGYQEHTWQDFIFFTCRSMVYGRLPVLREGQLPLPGLNEARALPAADDDFLKQVRMLVASRLDDPRLGVVDLERAMGMSHAQFYRRLERLLGYAGNELIRRMRIARAVALMERTEMRVSDIAYETGFRDPAYFSRVFREQLGVSPTTFRLGIRLGDKEKKDLHKD